MHNKFRETLDYIIKPAVRNSEYNLKVIRADEIDRSGSFIKDILESLLNSWVVIADLTGQNPNVFYELGVRHALSPRTILIAESIEDIPSDLREYRTIIYENSAKGAKLFQERLQAYLGQVFGEPARPDNPVLDRLPNISEQRNEELEKENRELRRQLENILKKGNLIEAAPEEEGVSTRVERIVALKNANLQTRFSPGDDGSVIFGKGRTEKTYHLPVRQGDFNLYFVMDGDTIRDYWYLAVIQSQVNFVEQLSDVRVLMERCSEAPAEFKFIIATNQDLSSVRKDFSGTFNKMKTFLDKVSRGKFSLELWDKNGLLKKEKEWGIKIDV